MNDRIELRGLQVTAICGVLPEEKVRRQPFEVDLDVHADLSIASISDDLPTPLPTAASPDWWPTSSTVSRLTSWSGSPADSPRPCWLSLGWTP